MSEKLLIVDDNKLNIMLLKQILEDVDYQVYTLMSGEDVLKTSRELKPVAILLDIMMPGIDGFEVCRLLKEDPDTKNIPVIMVTAKTQAEDLKRAFELGAFDYIKKPIDEIEVLARLRSAIRFREQEKKLEIMAMRDGLTGLYNHKLIIDLFKKEWIKANRNNESLAFLMIDIDFFKNVNDTYGHHAGDQVLKELSKILEENTRESDIVGRYGGEEFCVGLPNIDENYTFRLSERIRKAVEEKSLISNGRNINITISIGACLKYPESKASSEDMIIQADKALYKAKKLGRNRVELCILKK